MMNLPNILTCFRMVLVPVFAYCYFFVKPTWIALALFILASATDFLDGYLARKMNQITDFGKLMDPLADKLMTVTMMVCLACTRRIPWWAVIVITFKELFMVAGSTYMLKRRVVVSANIWGKAATVLFIAALALVFPLEGSESWYWFGVGVLYAAVAASLSALVVYVAQAYKNLKRRPA